MNNNIIKLFTKTKKKKIFNSLGLLLTYLDVLKSKINKVI